MAKSRPKGNRGELEFRTFCNDHLDEATAYRGDQRLGGHRASDVSGVRGYFIEAKRDEKIALPAWMAKIEEDMTRGSHTTQPVIAFRRNRDLWRVVITAEHWCDLVNAHRWARERGWTPEVLPWDR